MSFIGEHLDTIIVAIIAIVLGAEKFMKGTSTLRKEIAADYKERNEQLENRLKDFDNQLRQVNIDFSKLQGVLEEKEKHIKSLTEILQGRNPEMLALLKEISASNIKINEFMATMYQVLTTELSKQTMLLEEDKERSQKIEKASSTHEGDPVMIPHSNFKPKK